jgi:hypothetical protein
VHDGVVGSPVAWIEMEHHNDARQKT